MIEDLARGLSGIYGYLALRNFLMFWPIVNHAADRMRLQISAVVVFALGLRSAVRIPAAARAEGWCAISYDPFMISAHMVPISKPPFH